MRARRSAVALVCLVGLALVACTASPTVNGEAPASTVAASASPPGSAASTDPERAAEIDELVLASMDENDLRSVIIKVTVDGEEVITRAYGESMTGVPATTDMRFRNGAVAIAYVSHLLLQLVDEGALSLDDTVAEYLPDIGFADQVTVGQLARMTSGYRDYVTDPAFGAANIVDPFRMWTNEEKLGYVADEPLLFEPGTGWSYAHTNYVILGMVLEEVTGTPMAELMQERVLDPLGLDATVASQTGAIPDPAMHAFSSERRVDLGVPAGTPFYEESTFWNPSWTINDGAIQTTTIEDLNTSAIALGTGQLLSPESHEAMIGTDLRGFGASLPECGGSCFTQSEGYSYGYGIVTTGNWVMQNPAFGGFGAVMAYLPGQDIAVSIAVTFGEGSYDPADGSNLAGNAADILFRDIGAVLAPDDAPPTRPRPA